MFDATGGQPYYGPSFSTKKYYPAMETKQRAEARATCARGRSAAPRSSRAGTFPKTMQGNLIVLNTIGFRGLLNYKLTEDGAGLKSTEVEPILQSADENFRPVDAEVGPDGALYFADWHNPIIGHMQHNLRDTSRDHDARPRLSRHLSRAARCCKPARIAGAADPAAARPAEGAGGPRPLPRQDRAERARHQGGDRGAPGLDRTGSIRRTRATSTT